MTRSARIMYRNAQIAINAITISNPHQLESLFPPEDKDPPLEDDELDEDPTGLQNFTSFAP